MYQLNEFETWRERRSDLLREAEDERLARRLIGSARPENRWSKPAVALGILAALLVASLMLVVQPAHAANFTVNSTADPGSGVCNSTECTLREAIITSNLVDGPDTIRFNIPGAGVKSISPTSELPVITEAVTVDGYTQPGASANTLANGTNANIMIDLNGTNTVGNGLEIVADDVVVRGLAIGGFTNGIRIDDAEGVGPSRVRIEGNFLGTDASGTAARPNQFNGLSLADTGGDNTVGGTTRGARNLISGNGSSGVNTSNTTGAEVMGNLIGTDKSGTSPLPNGNAGVRIGGEGNTVGDLDPSDGLTNAANTIAFNDAEGVQIDDADNRVVRNFIFSNGREGVGVSSDISEVGNRILGNSIFSNGGLGIDLPGGTEDESGATANDRRDRDRGANGLQNKPVISSAINTSGGGSTIKGKLHSKPRKTFTLQFYSNPSGTDEGKTFVGEKQVRTNRNGNASFSFVPSQVIPTGEAVTATATGVEGTSEFSAPRPVAAG